MSLKEEPLVAEGFDGAADVVEHAIARQRRVERP
jgi:hypothetical protein